MKQLIQPVNVSYTGGWCENAVERAFFNRAGFYPSATTAWNAVRFKNSDTPPTGVWVPVFFSLGSREPNGHVAISAHDGRVLSSMLPGWHDKLYEYPNLQDLLNTYRNAGYDIKYLGWGADYCNASVVALEDNPTTSI